MKTALVNTHTDDCVHSKYYSGSDPCEPDHGVWMRPDGYYVSEADDDDAPWCRILTRAWHLQRNAERAEDAQAFRRYREA